MNERQDIKAFIDGELSPERAAEVRAAIDSDPSLMEEYKSMKEITQKLRALARSPQPKGAEAALTGAAKRRKFRWGEGIALAAVAAILVFFIAPKLVSRQFNAAEKSVIKTEPLIQHANPSVSAQDTGDATFGDRSTGKDAIAGAGKSVPSLSHMMPKRAGSESTKNRQESALANISGTRDYSLDSTTSADSDSQALRQVIKSASMIVAVSDVQKAVDDATLMVRGYGGYLESSSLDNAAGTEKPTGSMTIRIPQTNFEEALTKLRKYGRVESEQSNGDDVTAQVTDIEARIKTLKAEEDSYREILRNARKIADILELRDRISQIRQQIESYDARRLTLRRMAALSTISVRFDGPEKNEPKVVGADKPDTWFKDTYATATGMLKDVGRFVAQVLTFVFVLIPVWVPLALMALWFRKRAFHTEQTA